MHDGWVERGCGGATRTCGVFFWAPVGVLLFASMLGSLCMFEGLVAVLVSVGADLVGGAGRVASCFGSDLVPPEV